MEKTNENQIANCALSNRVGLFGLNGRASDVVSASKGFYPLSLFASGAKVRGSNPLGRTNLSCS
jgi:hypothetical protein